MLMSDLSLKQDRLIKLIGKGIHKANELEKKKDPKHDEARCELNKIIVDSLILLKQDRRFNAKEFIADCQMFALALASLDSNPSMRGGYFHA